MLATESVCQCACVSNVQVPFAPVRGNRLQMTKLAKSCGRRFRTPPSQTRIAVSRITHKSQIVRDRLRGDTEFFDNSPLVQRDSVSPVQLNDSRASNRLSQILVWRAEEYS